MRRSIPSVMGRFSAISCITDTSKPLSRATRSVKLSRKSISPRIARSVISFTLSPTPALMASSSITSVWISVESISKQMRRRIRRNIDSLWKEISILRSAEMRKRDSLRVSRSLGVPRIENSILAMGARASFSRGIRPVRRRILSILSP